jgi:hypothetical protein
MLDFNIGSFFDKFKNAALQEMQTRELMVRSIEKNTGVKLDIKEVELKNKIIRIKASPAAKNHIFMKKETILGDIRSQLGGYIIDDIH